MGDFNRHRPLWDEPRNTHLFTQENLDLAQPLLNLLGRHSMKMALPPYIPTLRAHNTGNRTRVDNVFCTEELMDAIIKCKADNAARLVKTDHFPIVTQFNIHATRTAWEPRHNYRLTDWTEFAKTLKENPANMSPPTGIKSIQDFDATLKNLNEAIRDDVTMTKPSPYSKRWWTAELANEKKKMQRLGGKLKYHRANPQHPIHEIYRQQRNHCSEQIRTAKAEHWAEWLQGLDEASVWQASRLATAPATDAGKARIPTLQIRDPVTKRVIAEAVDDDSNGRLFFENSFPPAKPITDPIPQDHRYPPPRWKFKNITSEQVHHAIKKLKPYKASRKGTVPNSVLMHAREDLVPHLVPLFRATNSLEYYPQEWALTETLIIKKPGRSDYTVSAAW
jgi:hypothetical protein